MLTVNNTLDGYLKDVEILGNTIQDEEDLADIRSVGDKVEGQELYEIPVLSCGKNLFNLNDEDMENGKLNSNTGDLDNSISGWKRMKKSKFIKSGVYILSSTVKELWRGMCLYDENGSFISYVGHSVSNSKITILNDCYYKLHLFTSSSLSDLNIQLEEGTVATPYEPYQEDKITILSPVQLEKVGDVADRLIEKDGVWGVEKNIIESVLDSNTIWSGLLTVDGYTSGWRTNNYSIVICDKLKQLTIDEWRSNTVKGLYSSSSNMGIIIPSSELNANSSSGLNEWIKNNQPTVKYVRETPQFIPLPHDQQVKLRTFANKTNISFLTEIEGTIKAQVPKSLGATVNTHTEQINNLNKELDRVKKLEESTVSTVTTESDFTTVEATSNGYFEDVKLEGKTLVNKLNPISNITESDTTFSAYTNTILEPSVYTIINNSAKEIFFNVNNASNGSYIATITLKANEKSKILKYDVQVKIVNFGGKKDMGWSENNKEDLGKQIILEGDHTQNPPSYFEGLKSVGQGTDEIVVSSVKGDGNLFDINNGFINNSNVFVSHTVLNNRLSVKITNSMGNGLVTYNLPDNHLVEDEVYTFSAISEDVSSDNVYTQIVDGEGKHYSANRNVPITFTKKGKMSIRLYGNLGSGVTRERVFYNITLTKGTTSQYTPHQSDKKRLLFYNTETQTWEKPILREWDSIEKHSNGKYYYHQRSGEVVLNGSENWISTGNGVCYGYQFSSQYENPISRTEVVCDKLLGIADTYAGNGFGLCVISHNSKLLVRVGVTQATTEEFKQWLQANNVTVVYQLAQEKVYECTNIDLITYANETNYVVECGVISPKSTLKVHNNISNVVKLLQEKVSLLESNVKASQEVQDMMILETDMRMLDIELALMEFVPMKINLGGSDMLRSATYFNFVKNHIINETYEKEYLENVMNKYLATGRINQDEYDELYKMLYPPVYDIELPIEP